MVVVQDSARQRRQDGRDVVAFGERASSYDEGWLGRMHHQICDRVAEIAVELAPNPRRILDVGCGTGYLITRLAEQLPNAESLVGVDAAEDMVRMAEQKHDDPRIAFAVARAERLPVGNSFDLVVSSTSFDHWSDQLRGLQECAQALDVGGHLVLCDLFSSLLIPTLIGQRRDKARTRHRATTLLTDAGFEQPKWHPIYSVLINAVSVTRN